MKNCAKKWRGLGHVTYILILGPPLLSPVRMKLQTSNFAAGSRVRNTKPKNEKLGQKGAWPRSRDLGHVTSFSILGPPIISGSDEASDVKFCSRIEGKEY